MPNEQKIIKSCITRKRGQDNKHIKNADDGTMSFMVWSIAGAVLAACSGTAGGADDLSDEDNPLIIGQDGPVLGARVYIDRDGREGYQEGGTDEHIGTTNADGVVASGTNLNRGDVVHIDVEGAYDSVTGRVLSGVWQSLPYDGVGDLLISPLTGLLAHEVDVATPTQLEDGIDAFIQDRLNRIFGTVFVENSADGTPMITLGDVLDPENYNPMNDGIKAQLISRAAIALTEIDGANFGTLQVLFTGIRNTGRVPDTVHLLGPDAGAVNDVLRGVADRPVVFEPNDNNPIRLREDTPAVLRGADPVELFGFYDPLGDDSLEGIYIQAQSVTRGITVMFRPDRGPDDALADADRGVPQDGNPAMAIIDGERFYFVSAENLDRLVLSPDTDVNGNFQIRFYVYDGEHTTIDNNVENALDVAGKLKIEVTPVNDAPVIRPSGTQNTLNEGTFSIDTNTGLSYTASDADGGTPVLSVSGDSRFKFDADGNLQIAANSRFDYETVADRSISLSISASDIGGRQPATETVTITFENVNDNAPEIRPSGAQNTLNEGTFRTDAPTNTGYSYTASDDDGGTSVLSVSGDPQDRFQLDASGNLQIKRGAEFDYETGTGPAITLTITATDSGVGSGSQAASTHEVIINFGNVNEAPTATPKAGILTADNVRYAFEAVDFGFRDVDADDRDDEFHSVIITSLPGAGRGALTLGGGSVGVGDEITLAQINDDQLVYTPGTLQPGQITYNAEIGYRVVDDGDGDGTNGLSSDAETLIIAVRENQPAMSVALRTQTLDDIDENTNLVAGMKVADLTVVDADGPPHRFELRGTNAEFFDIRNHNELWLVLEDGEGIDFEAAPRLTVQVVVPEDPENSGGSGGATITTGDITVTVNNVNEAPTATPKAGILTADNVRYAFEAVDFGFRDVDADDLDDEFHSVIITSLPGAGRGALTLGGTQVGVGDEITLAEINNDQLVYTPGTLQPGQITYNAEIGYQVVDDGDGDGANGLSSDAETLIIAVRENQPAMSVVLRTQTLDDIDENTNLVAGMKVADLTVVDADGPPHRFELRGTNAEFFEIRNHNELWLVLEGNEVLDYDTTPTPTSTLTVQVVVPEDSGGSGGATITTGDITVAVNNVNDNAPEIERTGDQNTLIERTFRTDAPTDTGYSYAASDADGGTSTLSLSEGDDDRFQLDAETGKLQIVAGAVFDYEIVADRAITLTIEAADSGAGSGAQAATDTETVTITFRDANDAPTTVPRADIVTNDNLPYALQAVDFGFRDVDAADDQFDSVIITSLPAQGRLALLNGDSVSAGDEITFADISDGQLVYTPVVVPQEQTTYDAEIGYQVVDGGNSGGANKLSSDEATLVIAVGQNQPAMSVALKTQSLHDIDENTDLATGRMVAELTVTDTDGLPHRLEVAGDNAGFFEIRNEDELWLVVGEGEGIDFEATPTLTVQVVVPDSTITTGDITVMVNNVNEAPMATPRTDLETPDNTHYALQAVDFGFRDVDANDRDDEFHSVIITSLPGAGQGALWFNEDAVNAGDVITLSQINAGQLVYRPAPLQPGQTTYNAEIGYQVVDGGDTDGGNKLSSDAATLTIVVGDNLPATGVTLGRQDVTAIDENTDLSAGLKVAKLTVTDTDGSPHRLDVAGDDAGFFEIRNDDELWLVLEGSEVLDFETIPTSTLTVQVVVPDSTITTGDITVMVNNVNDNVPEITPSGTQEALNEGTFRTDVPTDTGLGYTARDADGGTSILSLSEGDDDRFQLDGSGDLQIKAGAEFDYEVDPSITLTITAMDSGEGSGAQTVADTEVVTINFEDVNDAPTAEPRIGILTNDHRDYAIQAADFGFRDEDVGDLDDQFDSVIITSLPAAGRGTLLLIAGAGNETPVSAGDEISLAQIAADQLVYRPGALPQGQDTYNAEIGYQVVDDGDGAGGNKLSSDMASLIIAVGENQPAMSVALGTQDVTDIDENADLTAGLKVATLTVTDTDGSPHGLEVRDANVGFFDIRNEDELWLVLNTDEVLDYEATPVLTVRVGVAGAPAIPTAEITVMVNNLNDNLPEITPSGSQETLNEGSFRTDVPTDTGLSYAARDADGGTSILSLSEGDDDRFQLDGSGNLQIKAGAEFDYENTDDQTITLTITATDSGAGSGGDDTATDTEAVTINFGDVNEAPTATPRTDITTADNTDYAFAAVDFGFNDVDADDLDDEFDSVAITSLPAAGQGTLLLITGAGNETPVSVGDDFTLAQITASQLVYRPAALPQGQDTYNAGIGYMVVDGGDEAGANKLNSAEAMLMIAVGGNQPATGVTLGVQHLTAIDENTDLTAGMMVAGLTVMGDPDGSPHGLEVRGANANLFEIRNENELWLVLEGGEVLDYDTTPTLTVEVGVAGAPAVTTGDITVTVNNLNDNTPVIVPSGGQITLNEGIFPNTPTDTGLSYTARDADGGTSILSLAEDDDDRFQLDGSGKLQIVANAVFDYENTDDRTITLTLTATDSGEGGASTATVTETITINFEDVNEAPTATPKEGLSIAVTDAHTFSAVDFGFRDEDVGDLDDQFDSVIITALPARGTLTLGGTAVNVNDSISLGDITTLVYTPNALQQGETRFTADISYMVVDGGDGAGGNKLSSDVATFVIVVGENESATGVSLLGVQQLTAIDENTVTTGMKVADLMVDDDDDAPHRLEVRGSNANLFEIRNDNELWLVSGNGELDYDTSPTPTSTLTVQVGVSGVPAITTGDINVVVNNLNDNAPVIAPEGGQITLTERTYPNALTDTGLSYTASDADGGTSALELSGDDRFQLDGSGNLQIVANAVFDYENTDDRTITLTLTATDSGEGGASTTTATETITINLEDVNEAPTATPRIGILTNDHRDHIFGAVDFGFRDVDAGDPDDEFHSVIITSLPGAGRGALTHIVGDVATSVGVGAGAEFTLAQINAGQLVYRPAEVPQGQTSYNAGIGYQVVDDGDADGSNKLSSVAATLMIEVGRNQPAMGVTLRQQDVTAIDENTNLSAGMKVADLNVTDDDSAPHRLEVRGDNARFFEIRNDNELWLVLVDGEVLDYETEATRTLTVEVVVPDSTITTGDITVMVNNVNDNVPEITPSGTQEILNEGTFRTDAPTDTGLSYTARDADGGTSILSLSEGDDNRFQLDGSGNLQIKAGAEFDYEVDPSITLTITATDSGEGSGAQTVADTEVVTINFEDVNDAPTAEPRIGILTNDHRDYAIQAADFGFRDEDVGDFDDQFNSVIITSLPGAGRGTLTHIVGDVAALVDVGAVFTLAQINVGQLVYRPAEVPQGQTTYNAEIGYRVVDDGDAGGGNGLSSDVASLIIAVGKNQPAMSVTLGTQDVIDIDENADLTAGLKVATLTVVDTDDPPHRLEVRGENARFFDIRNDDELWLVLEAGAVLDYEAAPMLKVRVGVEGAPAITTAEITVMVNNLNDNVPMIVPSGTQKTLNEGTFPNTPTDTGLSYTARDADDADGETSVLSVSDSRFEIDSATGNLRIKANSMFDYETLNHGGVQGAIQLTITAADSGEGSGNSPGNATHDVTINFEDVNEAPTATPRADISTADNLPYRFEAMDFGFRDVDADDLDDQFHSVIITSLPGAGQGALTFNGAAVNVGNVITLAQITARQLVYTPADVPPEQAIYNAEIGYMLRDGGDAVGGNKLSSDAATLVVAVRGNQPARGVELKTQSLTAIDENTDLTAGRKVAELTITDTDGPPHRLEIRGPNAEFFDIRNHNELWLVLELDETLDHESTPMLTARVEVSEDATITTGAITVTVNNVNDAPAITSTPEADRTITDDDAMSATNTPAPIVGNFMATDADGDNLTWRIDTRSPNEASYGRLTVNADGRWEFALNAAGAEVINKRGHDDPPIELTYTIEVDDNGAQPNDTNNTAAEEFTIRLVSVDDVPTNLEPVSGGPDEPPQNDLEVQRPGGRDTEGDLAASGVLRFMDIDGDAFGDSHIFIQAAPNDGDNFIDGSNTANEGIGTLIEGSYGDLYLKNDGTWSYALDASKPLTQMLGNGDRAADRFSLRIQSRADASAALNSLAYTLEVTVRGMEVIALTNPDAVTDIAHDGVASGRIVAMVGDNAPRGTTTFSVGFTEDSAAGAMSIDGGGDRFEIDPNDGSWTYTAGTLQGIDISASIAGLGPTLDADETLTQTFYVIASNDQIQQENRDATIRVDVVITGVQSIYLMFVNDAGETVNVYSDGVGVLPEGFNPQIDAGGTSIVTTPSSQLWNIRQYRDFVQGVQEVPLTPDKLTLGELIFTSNTPGANSADGVPVISVNLVVGTTDDGESDVVVSGEAGDAARVITITTPANTSWDAIRRAVDTATDIVSVEGVAGRDLAIETLEHSDATGQAETLTGGAGVREVPATPDTVTWGALTFTSTKPGNNARRDDAGALIEDDIKPISIVFGDDLEQAGGVGVIASDPFPHLTVITIKVHSDLNRITWEQVLTGFNEGAGMPSQFMTITHSADFDRNQTLADYFAANPDVINRFSESQGSGEKILRPGGGEDAIPAIPAVPGIPGVPGLIEDAPRMAVGMLIGTLDDHVADTVSFEVIYHQAVPVAERLFAVKDNNQLYYIGGEIGDAGVAIPDKHTIALTAHDAEGEFVRRYEYVINIEEDLNQPPTDIAFSVEDGVLDGPNMALLEYLGATAPVDLHIATLTSTDPNDPNGTGIYAYTIGNVGAGTNAGAFAIRGVNNDELWLVAGADIAEGDTWNIEITSTDPSRFPKSYSETFSVMRIMSSNYAPTAIEPGILVANYEGDMIPEGGVMVARLTTTDDNIGDMHTYTIAGAHEPLFEIRGVDNDELWLVAGAGIAEGDTWHITIASTDSGGLSVSENFSVVRNGLKILSVNDAGETQDIYSDGLGVLLEEFNPQLNAGDTNAGTTPSSQSWNVREARDIVPEIPAVPATYSMYDLGPLRLISRLPGDSSPSTRVILTPTLDVGAAIDVSASTKRGVTTITIHVSRDLTETTWQDVYDAINNDRRPAIAELDFINHARVSIIDADQLDDTLESTDVQIIPALAGGAGIRAMHAMRDILKVGQLTITSTKSGFSATPDDNIPQIVFTIEFSDRAKRFTPIIETEGIGTDLIEITALVSDDVSTSTRWFDLHSALAKHSPVQPYVRFDVATNGAIMLTREDEGTYLLSGGMDATPAIPAVPLTPDTAVLGGDLTFISSTPGDNAASDTDNIKEIRLSFMTDAQIPAHQPDVSVAQTATRIDIVFTVRDDLTTTWAQLLSAFDMDADMADDHLSITPIDDNFDTGQTLGDYFNLMPNQPIGDIIILRDGAGVPAVPLTPDTATWGPLTLTAVRPGSNSIPNDDIRPITLNFSASNSIAADTPEIAVEIRNDETIITITVRDDLTTTWAQLLSAFDVDADMADDHLSITPIDDSFNTSQTLGDYFADAGNSAVINRFTASGDDAALALVGGAGTPFVPEVPETPAMPAVPLTPDTAVLRGDLTFTSSTPGDNAASDTDNIKEIRLSFMTDAQMPAHQPDVSVTQTATRIDIVFTVRDDLTTTWAQLLSAFDMDDDMADDHLSITPIDDNFDTGQTLGDYFNLMPNEPIGDIIILRDGAGVPAVPLTPDTATWGPLTLTAVRPGSNSTPNDDIRPIKLNFATSNSIAADTPEIAVEIRNDETIITITIRDDYTTTWDQLFKAFDTDPARAYDHITIVPSGDDLDTGQTLRDYLADTGTNDLVEINTVTELTLVGGAGTPFVPEVLEVALMPDRLTLGELIFTSSTPGANSADGVPVISVNLVVGTAGFGEPGVVVSGEAGDAARVITITAPANTSWDAIRRAVDAATDIVSVEGVAGRDLAIEVLEHSDATARAKTLTGGAGVREVPATPDTVTWGALTFTSTKPGNNARQDDAGALIRDDIKPISISFGDNFSRTDGVGITVSDAFPHLISIFISVHSDLSRTTWEQVLTGLDTHSGMPSQFITITHSADFDRSQTLAAYFAANPDVINRFSAQRTSAETILRLGGGEDAIPSIPAIAGVPAYPAIPAIPAVIAVPGTPLVPAIPARIAEPAEPAVPAILLTPDTYNLGPLLLTSTIDGDNSINGVPEIRIALTPSLEVGAPVTVSQRTAHGVTVITAQVSQDLTQTTWQQIHDALIADGNFSNHAAITITDQDQLGDHLEPSDDLLIPVALTGGEGAPAFPATHDRISFGRRDGAGLQAVAVRPGYSATPGDDIPVIQITIALDENIKSARPVITTPTVSTDLLHIVISVASDIANTQTAWAQDVVNQLDIQNPNTPDLTTYASFDSFASGAHVIASDAGTYTLTGGRNAIPTVPSEPAIPEIPASIEDAPQTAVGLLVGTLDDDIDETTQFEVIYHQSTPIAERLFVVGEHNQLYYIGAETGDADAAMPDTYTITVNALDAAGELVREYEYIVNLEDPDGEVPPERLFVIPTRTVKGTTGDDAGATAITGTGATELVQGGIGDDHITPGGGGDVVIGGYGSDIIELGTGAATGAETIVYRFESDANAEGAWRATDGDDEIRNFRRGVDKLIFVDVSDDTPINDLAEYTDDTDKPSVLLFNSTDAAGQLAIQAVVIGFGLDGTRDGVSGSTGRELFVTFDEETRPLEADFSAYISGVTFANYDHEILNQLFGGTGQFNALEVVKEADLPEGLIIEHLIEAPVIADTAGSITDDDVSVDDNTPAPVSGDFMVTSGDVDTWTPVRVPANPNDPEADNYGTVTFTGDRWTFTLNAAGRDEINRLDADDAPTVVTFDVTATNRGGADTARLAINLVGINDSPVLNAPTIPEIVVMESEATPDSEMGTLTFGSDGTLNASLIIVADINDTDDTLEDASGPPSAGRLTSRTRLADRTLEGQYGDFVLTRDDGTGEIMWRYTVDEARANALSTYREVNGVAVAGTFGTDILSLRVWDGDGRLSSETRDVQVEVRGTNDAPTSSITSGTDTVAYDERGTISTSVLFDDIDNLNSGLTVRAFASGDSSEPSTPLYTATSPTDLDSGANLVSGTYGEFDITRNDNGPSGMGELSITYDLDEMNTDVEGLDYNERLYEKLTVYVNDGAETTTAQTFDVTIERVLFAVPTRTVKGTASDDAGATAITGTGATELIQGGIGNDHITPGGGGDVVIGGYGTDIIELGTGAATGAETIVYRFESDANAEGAWRATDGGYEIRDFRRGVDKLIFVDVSDDTPINNLDEFIADGDVPGISLFPATNMNGQLVIRDVLISFGLRGSRDGTGDDTGFSQEFFVTFDEETRPLVADFSAYISAVTLTDYEVLYQLFGGTDQFNALEVVTEADLPEGLNIL